MFKGTNQSSDSETELEKTPTIQKSMVLNERFDSNHLICSICMHIVWDPLVCGSQTGCHNVFCSNCISQWIQSSNRSCPTCKRQFVASTPPPIIKSLLHSLILKCPYHKNGCEDKIEYARIDEHILSCEFMLQMCKGCRQKIIKRDYDKHVEECLEIIIQCPKCRSMMTKGVFQTHTKIDCIGTEIENCGNRVQNIEHAISEINSSLTKLEDLTKCFLLGEPLQLNIQLYTTFNQHFIFPNPTLIKPSFNQQKERFDFLHFYILNPIYTDSITSIKWAIKINKMVGNILLGFCSNMGIHSLDYIINKYGQIKRKNTNETKYKFVKKSEKGFCFNCGDVLRFRYYSLRKCIRIENQNKKLWMTLDSFEVQNLGDRVYVFYSMDTLNDSISFL